MTVPESADGAVVGRRLRLQQGGMKVKTRRWIAAAGMAAALALFAGNAQATDDETTDDETTYHFRLVNEINKATRIRCGSSGSWTIVGIGDSTDLYCSQSSAQTKLGEGSAADWNHDCPTDTTVKRFRYHGRYLATRYRVSLYVACVAS